MRIPKRDSSVAWREIGSEAVLADPGASKAYVLNPWGTVLWRLADGSMSEDEMAALMPRHIAPSVPGFFSALASAGLIGFASSPSPGRASAGTVEKTAGGLDEPPRIVSAEPLEVLATVCLSGHTGATDCRTEGSCVTAFS